MAKLSVIIPVYNTEEQLLKQCLDSVFDSTIKDLEVIIIDDGSTKDYSKILKISKSIKYIKTENHGTLKARLLGIEHAKSDYVCFVDSDDFVSFNYFEAQLTQIQNQNADICLNDWAFQSNQTKYVCINDTTIKTDINYEGNQPLQKFFEQAGREHSYYVLWNKIFKREILDFSRKQIEKLGLTNLSFAEDVLICYFANKYAKKVTNIHLGYYFYRIHTSQETNVLSAEKLKNHIESMTTVFTIIENDLKDFNFYKNVEKFFLQWKDLLCTTDYSVAKRSRYKELFSFLKEKYHVEKFKCFPFGHTKAYIKQKLLPTNLNEIDTDLKKVYYSNKHLKVYAKKHSYVYDSLLKMKDCFGLGFSFVENQKQATIVCTKENISLKQRILHNRFVFKLGMLLFPKGSKIRKFLKSKI